MAKKFIGNRPHPKMQEEFLTEPSTVTGKAAFNKLVTKRGMKDEKVG